MRVLVTGGAGYIGSHTCVELLEAGHEVFVIDNLSNGHEEAINRIRNITNIELSFIKADIRDSNALDKVFGTFKHDSHFVTKGVLSILGGIALPYGEYGVVESGFGAKKVTYFCTIEECEHENTFGFEGIFYVLHEAFKELL